LSQISGFSEQPECTALAVFPLALNVVFITAPQA
jgi:hypothetical protein